MIRETRFLISKRPYAVDLASLAHTENAGYKGRPYWWCSVNAVWFRRRKGTTVACAGTLRSTMDTCPREAAEFLAAYDDGRYGGDCSSRWDGTSFWTAIGDPDVQAEHLALLKPMLDRFPDVPDGYDGWWRF